KVAVTYQFARIIPGYLAGEVQSASSRTFDRVGETELHGVVHVLWIDGSYCHQLAPVSLTRRINPRRHRDTRLFHPCRPGVRTPLILCSYPRGLSDTGTGILQ